MKKTLIIFAALALLAACAKQNPANEVELVPMTFGVSVDKPVTPEAPNSAPELRTQLNDLAVEWKSGDKIGIIPKGSTTIYPFTTTESGTSVSFTGTAAKGDDDTYYAVYPYDGASRYVYTKKSPMLPLFPSPSPSGRQQWRATSRTNWQLLPDTAWAVRPSR